jgi:sulfide:quinone oxidoreductase
MAGVTTAARLRRAGVRDVAVVEPSDQHYYQPLWTLVGGGLARAEKSVRPQASVMPKGVTWLRDAAVGVDPGSRRVSLQGGEVGYEFLVMAPGIQLNWGKVAGLNETLGTQGVSSNYRYDLAPLTWNLIRSTRSGTAVFTMPAGPIKCAGAPQKIAYLACDYWRRQGVLSAIDVHLVLPTPGMFGVPLFADILARVAADYGITVHFSSEVVEVDPDAREVVVRDLTTDTKSRLPYSMLHATPPQSAPDWVATGPLADPASPFGYIDVDKHTMQHVRHPEIFAVGDAGSTPNSKTGAAIRKQAPVAVANLLAQRAGKPLPGSYTGYASCPLTTARDKILIAEFDYTLTPTPTLPLVNTKREIRDLGTFKKYGLPTLYWGLMRRGLA